LKERGYQGVVGPKPVIEQSFQDGYIKDGKLWMSMLKSRNLTSHTYDEQTADEIVTKIQKEYYFLIKELRNTLSSLQG
jgi:nucleotidyltransferase substrate binding protein (TIGR01987 family)